MHCFSRRLPESLSSIVQQYLFLSEWIFGGCRGVFSRVTGPGLALPRQQPRPKLLVSPLCQQSALPSRSPGPRLHELCSFTALCNFVFARKIMKRHAMRRGRSEVTDGQEEAEALRTAGEGASRRNVAGRNCPPPSAERRAHRAHFLLTQTREYINSRAAKLGSIKTRAPSQVRHGGGRRRRGGAPERCG
jgi:hypothetical protein